MSLRKVAKSIAKPSMVLLENLAVIGLSLLVGWLTYRLGGNSKYVVPFWPLSGISLYLYLRRGSRLIPGLFIGVFLLTLLFAERPYWLCLLNALGNTAETIAAGLIFQSLQRHSETFGRFFNLFRIIIAGSVTPIPTSIIASFYLTGLRGLGVIEGVQLGIGWWLGHFIGILVFLPLLLNLSGTWRITKRQSLFFIVSLASMGVLEFYILWYPEWRYSIFSLFIGILFTSVFLAAPLLQLQGMLLHCLSIVIYVQGGGINAHASDFGRLLTLQVFMSMISLTVLSLVALAWKDVRKFSFITLFGAWAFFGVLYKLLSENGIGNDTALMLFICLATLISLSLSGFVHHLETIEKESRTLLSKVMNSVPIGIFHCRNDGRLTVCNREWSMITGQSYEDCVGSNWLETVHPSEREALRADLKRIGELESIHGEYRILRPDGSSRFVQLKLVCEDRRELVEELGVLGVIQDISEMKAARDALETHRAMALHSAKMAALGEMAGGIAHEINNPLAIIHAQSHSMRTKIRNKSFDSETMLHTLGQIEDTVARISKVTRSLLDFSGNGSSSSILKPVALKDLIQGVLTYCQDRFRSAGIDLQHTEIPDVWLHGSENQLRQLIVNLLNNAFDAVRDMDEKWVFMDFEISHGKIRISVMDSGPGVDAAIREKIFDPFFTTKDLGKGNGLGLSVARGLSLEHRGNLYLDPQSRQTRFVFEMNASESTHSSTPN